MQRGVQASRPAPQFLTPSSLCCAHRRGAPTLTLQGQLPGYTLSAPHGCQGFPSISCSSRVNDCRLVLLLWWCLTPASERGVWRHREVEAWPTGLRMAGDQSHVEQEQQEMCRLSLLQAPSAAGKRTRADGRLQRAACVCWSATVTRTPCCQPLCPSVSFLWPSGREDTCP